MTTALPGYARPTEDPLDIEPIEIGSPNALTWRPLGGFLSREVEYDWSIPGYLTLELQGDHPAVPYLMGCRRKVIHLRTTENGEPWDGRVMEARARGKLGREIVTITAIDNRIWTMSGLAWVNNQLPPEVQINLTGKQDVRFGPFDMVSKSYVASIMTRLRKPVYGALPIDYGIPELPDLEDINTLDDLLGFIDTATEDLVVWSARFTQFDELMSQDVDRLGRGTSCHLWTPSDGTPSPQVFRTDTLALLQSVLDYTSDNFLNFSNPNNILQLESPSEWGKMTRAGYAFDTHRKVDKTHMQWRGDGTQIVAIDRNTKHMTAHRVVVGGKAPEILNQVIEWGANFAIQLLLNAIAPGLGLGFVVGDLFDNVFFAYQQFWDPTVESDPDLGEHALGEKFADNTAAYSLDSAAVGLSALRAHSGTDSITITISGGGPDGRGFRFGADDGSGKTFRVGDIMTLYHLGTTVQQFVSKVVVRTEPGQRKEYTITLGDRESTADGLARIVGRIQGLAGTSRAIANSI